MLLKNHLGPIVLLCMYEEVFFFFIIISVALLWIIHNINLFKDLCVFHNTYVFSYIKIHSKIYISK